MKQAHEEFKDLIRIEFGLSKQDLSDNDIKVLFMVSWLNGQKEAILNPLI